MALVFQYDSNCSESQFNSPDRLCGDAKFLTIAETVDDYELAFDVWRTRRGCAASDIVPSTGNKVWGVVYDVPDFLIARDTAAQHRRKSLDAIEGEGTNYTRHPIIVKSATGEPLTAITYRVIDPRSGLRTSLESVLLFWSLDRLSREGVLETIQHLNRLTSYAVNYRSFTEQYFDSCGIFKDAVISILATIANQERIGISERVRAGLVRARSRGQRLGRPHVVLDARRIATLRAQGLGWKRIATEIGVGVGTLYRCASKCSDNCTADS